MKPELWGPFVWYVLHIISFNYPINPSQFEKTAYREFYMNVKNVLPCESCRRHYSTYLSIYPISPHMDSRATLIKWVIQVHNFVNKQLGKRLYSVPEILNIYKNLQPQSLFNPVYAAQYTNPSTRMWLLISVCAAIAIWMKMYYSRHHFASQMWH
jgi:hypothetical protein